MQTIFKAIQEQLDRLKRRVDRLDRIQSGGLPTVESWIVPTFNTNWNNFSTIDPAGYYKDSFGRVYLKGLVNNTTSAGPTTIFTLPIGYRPAFTSIYPVGVIFGSSYVTRHVEINTSGNVISINNTTSDALSLVSISFRAA